MAEDIGKVCICIPHTQNAGGGHFEFLLEYDPACALHSYHLYHPTRGEWLLSQTPHELMIVEGEIEVCNTCRNMYGELVAWDQTWHALHKDKARQVQHTWEPIKPGAERLVPMCGDPLAKFTGFNTAEERQAVPVCPVCHSKAVAKARREEWDKVTSDQAVNIFKVGWHIGNRLGKPKTRTGLERIRELIGR